MSELQHAEEDSLVSGDLQTWSELQHAEEDSLVDGDLQTCPSYNMLRKTHLSVETCRHFPATTC